MSLRLRDWKRESLEAGLYVLIAVIIGGLLLYWGLHAPSTALQASGSPGKRCLLTSQDQFREAVSSGYTAVMFSSDTCPVCRKMEPYWSRLCGSEGPVSYYILKLNRDTYQVFMEYGVLETPTFIVFKDGQPVARHVGGFPEQGEATTGIMREWVEANIGRGLESVLPYMDQYCGQCHTLPRGLDADSVRAWINENPRESLARLVAEAARRNITVSQLYNGTSNLVLVIMNMSRQVNLTLAEKMALALDAMSMSLQEGRGKATPLGEQQEHAAEASASPEAGALLGSAAALLAGLIAAFSPCVFPLLISYTSTLAARGRGLGPGSAVAAMAASALGVLSIGLLFVLLGDAVQRASSILLPTAALALTAAGILGYLDVPTFVSIGRAGKRRGLIGFSFLYGLLAVQCSFPLVAGALLLLTSGGLEQGLMALAAFTLGISVPVALAVYASGRRSLAGLLARLSSKSGLRLANLAMAVAGVALLAYSLGVV